MTLKVALCVFLFSLSGSAQFPSSALVAPAKLAAQVTNNSAPNIVYVGFPVLYKGAHISKAIFAGPCSKQEGLDLLTTSVKNLAHDAAIVIYCGCCPFVRCPNVGPAFKALKDAGYTNIKVLELETNLHADWVQKGYPIEKQ